MVEIGYEYSDEFLRCCSVSHFDCSFNWIKYINPKFIESVTPKEVHFSDWTNRDYYHVIMQSGDNFYVKDNPLEGQ